MEFPCTLQFCHRKVQVNSPLTAPRFLLEKLFETTTTQYIELFTILERARKDFIGTLYEFDFELISRKGGKLHKEQKGTWVEFQYIPIFEGMIVTIVSQVKIEFENNSLVDSRFVNMSYLT